MLSARRLYSTAKKHLLDPEAARRVIVNYWQPGYKINGVFTPTSTVEAAISFLVKQGLGNEHLYKDEIHPGHFSLESRTQYLSIGTLDDFSSIGVKTTHKLVRTTEFVKDVFGLERFPEKRFVFHSLNHVKVNKLVLKIIQLVDNDLGLYGIMRQSTTPENEVYSCASSTYECLKVGGIESLMTPYRLMLPANPIIIPSVLADRLLLAQITEHELFPEASKLFMQCEEEYSSFKTKFESQRSSKSSVSPETDDSSKPK